MQKIMKQKTMQKKYALCPFFESVNDQRLKCEQCEIKFPDITDRTLWLKMHCFTWDFKICTFYRKLMKKYDAIDTAPSL